MRYLGILYYNIHIDIVDKKGNVAIGKFKLDFRWQLFQTEMFSFVIYIKCVVISFSSKLYIRITMSFVICISFMPNSTNINIQRIQQFI